MTPTVGCTATTAFAGTASPSAGETSPAQIGLMPAVGAKPSVVEAVPLFALALRNVSESNLVYITRYGQEWDFQLELADPDGCA